jgi:hypothetical protein
MNAQQVLYQAKLAKEGRKLTWAGLAVSVLLVGLGVVLWFVDSFPSNIGVMVIIGIGVAGVALQSARVSRLWNNPGDYRISIDDYGLYFHSDEPSRRTIKRYESCDDYEYYVETRSGTRHRIGQLFAD